MRSSGPYTLESRRLGALPLVAHFAGRMGLPGLLDRWVPPDDTRLALDPATVLGAVVANLCTGHRPLYALGEWAAQFEPGLLGLAAGQAGLLLIGPEGTGSVDVALAMIGRRPLKHAIKVGHHTLQPGGVHAAHVHHLAGRRSRPPGEAR